MHTVAVIALHGTIPFEVGIACEVFGRAAVPGVAEPYRVRVCGEAREVKAGAFDLRVPCDLSHAAGADTVLVPGIANPGAPVADEAVTILRAAAARGARVASICTGAFVLAAAGLLDGLRATTHRRAAAELAARYPAVTVDANVLYVDNGRILTSAGATAGLDLCLHMVRTDYGAAAAADAARLAVMPLERDGGQAQFIVHEPPRSPATLAPLLHWMAENLHRPLTLDGIARHAAMSPRTLSRRFREQAGTTPLQWVLAARVRRAQALLETTAMPVEQVAAQAGFESAVALRERFATALGTSPTSYRRAMGGTADGCRLTALPSVASRASA